jgi:tRNA U34 5-methylaminomethyl-2-thiouridine-forming methyltransferase MnmC
LQKKQQDFQTVADENAFDLIYYDAFAPNSQPELWTIDIFEKMYRALRPQGILTTYCAKGQVKRNLRAAGFRIENLPGPIGKREMTRAIKE